QPLWQPALPRVPVATEVEVHVRLPTGVTPPLVFAHGGGAPRATGASAVARESLPETNRRNAPPRPPAVARESLPETNRRNTPPRPPPAEELRQALGWRDRSLRRQLSRLARLEYLLTYRTGRGNGRAYQLLYDPETDAATWPLGLCDVEQLPAPEHATDASNAPPPKRWFGGDGPRTGGPPAPQRRARGGPANGV
ncbi:MAG: hypothetical protein R6U98_18020, partial [Pirellulaceae bacterium]